MSTLEGWFHFTGQRIIRTANLRPCLPPLTTANGLRCDAERNRQLILSAAAGLIAEHGLSVSHDQIAKAADVAAGTVYHRFPTKSSLIEALYTDQVDAVVSSARATNRWRSCR